MIKINANSWYHRQIHGQLCQVRATDALGRDDLPRIPAANLKPMSTSQYRKTGLESLAVPAAATRVACLDGGSANE